MSITRLFPPACRKNPTQPSFPRRVLAALLRGSGLLPVRLASGHALFAAHPGVALYLSAPHARSLSYLPARTENTTCPASCA